jgi:hypothetical protein
MKVDKLYDVTCFICGHHLSSHFSKGYAETPVQAEIWAKDVGFKTRNGHNICPECLKSGITVMGKGEESC